MSCISTMSMSRWFFAVAVLLLAIPRGDAFAPILKSRVPSPSSSSASSSALDATPLAWAASPAVMYSLMSFNEYITHRFYQHGDAKFDNKYLGGNNIHIEHHAETLDDMSLKTDANWLTSPAAKKLEGNPYRGTAFTYKVVRLMFLQMLPTCLPILHWMGFSALSSLMLIVSGLFVHTAVWNALHPAMHYLPDVPLSAGPPSSIFAQYTHNWFFRFLYTNHQGHHVLGGTCNFNVCCPGADHLFGTYVKESVWRKNMKAVAAERETNKDENNVHNNFVYESIRA